MFDITQEEDYRELTLEEQYLVNGGDHIENSIEAQAGASVGDTLTREDGTTWTLTQGDINWAREQIGASGSGGNPGASSGSPDNGPSGNPESGSDNSSNNNNPFANSNTPWGADEQMEAARLAKEKGNGKERESADGLKPNELIPEDLSDMGIFTKLIENEKNVKKYLEVIKQDPDNYSIEAYQRKALFAYKWERGKLLTHSLYVITNKSTGEKKTLSFNGTGPIGVISQGAWAINTETDVEGWNNYINGNNNYDMTVFTRDDNINVQQTSQNIIDSINSKTSYIFIDHKINLPFFENCNTALYNTMSRYMTHSSGKF